MPGRFETIEQRKARAIADGVKTTAARIAATWFLNREGAPAFEACAAIAVKSSPEAIDAGLDAMQDWRGDDFLQLIQTETLALWGTRHRTYQRQQAKQLWQKNSQRKPFNRSKLRTCRSPRTAGHFQPACRPFSFQIVPATSLRQMANAVDKVKTAQIGFRYALDQQRVAYRSHCTSLAELSRRAHLLRSFV